MARATSAQRKRPFLTYYRHGELVTLLELRPGQAHRDVQAGDLAQLRHSLQAVSGLSRTENNDPLYDGSGGPLGSRPTVVLRRNPGPHASADQPPDRALQCLNLASWIPDLTKIDPEHNDNDFAKASASI